jgi:hypothetical protein
MTTALDVLAAHGITTTDAEFADLVRAAIDELPLSGSAGLPEDEARLYDEAGLSADEHSYRRQVAARSARYATMIASAIPVTAAAKRLGLTRARVQQLISAGEVWAVRDARERWVLPQLQFDGEHLLAGWAAISRALPKDMHPLEVLGLLTTPQPELRIEGTPVAIVDWLRDGGDPGAAARIAAATADIAG